MVSGNLRLRATYYLIYTARWLFLQNSKLTAMKDLILKLTKTFNNRLNPHHTALLEKAIFAQRAKKYPILWISKYRDYVS